MSPIDEHGLDALLPLEMARTAEAVGEKKAQLDAITTFVLALLAGAFIALASNFATVAAAGTSEVWPYGATRILAGIAFSLGLILVVVGGAELFTGNTPIVMAWASGRVRTAALLRNWAIVCGPPSTGRAVDCNHRTAVASRETRSRESAQLIGTLSMVDSTMPGWLLIR